MSEQSRLVEWGDEEVVTTDDGREFRCRVEQTGSQREWRWVFRSADGAIIVGPPWWGPIATEELRRILSRWRHTHLEALDGGTSRGADTSA